MRRARRQPAQVDRTAISRTPEGLIEIEFGWKDENTGAIRFVSYRMTTRLASDLRRLLRNP